VSVHDPELLELLLDKPELLAIADAVSATQTWPRRSLSGRRSMRVVAIAAAAALAVAVVLVLPGGKHSIVDRAAAAIGDGRILHLVIQAPTGVVDVNLASGRREIRHYRLELWADQQLRHIHGVMTYRGKTVADMLWPEDAKNGVTIGPSDPALTALWSGYRKALEDGTATRAGEGNAFGHHVYWLRFRPVDKSPGSEVAVDAETYKPIVWRTYNGVLPIDQHILLAETTDLAHANFTRSGPDLSTQGIAYSSSSSTVSGPMSSGGNAPSTAVPSGWLTAGSEAAGKQLSAVLAQTITTSDKKKIPGIQLVYGPLDHGRATPRDLTVDELARPDDPQQWANIPADSVRIAQGQMSGSNGDHVLWYGYLVRNGRYLTITTTDDEQAVVDVAKSLQPVR
jgi:hypothetical protein